MQSPIVPFDTRSFRDSLGKFTTGVTLVTTQSDKGDMGILVNSFASVSLKPPLVLWSIDKSSKRRAAFEAAERTAIHILADAQRNDCMGFTKDAFGFGGLTLADNPGGPPLVEGCLTRFECEPYATYEAGDHIIFISRVVNLTTRDASPMVFFNGAFGTLSTADDQ
ncbi:flavin reductase family protein [Sulfitobacter sp. S190]|nr:flavin reductase family protein [Sulfitobacter sp. S190]